MDNLAIIPARGGSKRIPRKNIKNFLGKPIISYSIEAALKSGLFEEVIVSTDDDEMAEVAIKYGAKVPFLRSIENSNDFSTTTDVLIEVIEKLESNNQSYLNACCIYPTSPLLKIDTLVDAFNLLISENYDTTFPVVKFGYPIQRSLKIEQKNKVFMNWSENLNKRSQDLQELYHDAGMFYWFKTRALKKEKALFTNNSGAVIIEETQSQDIDNLVDWRLAELKFKMMHGL